MAIFGILDTIGNALNPAFGMGGNGNSGSPQTLNDFGLGFLQEGGGYGVTAGGQQLPPDALEPLAQAMSYAMWISLAVLAGALILGGAQLGWARSQGYEPNAGAQRTLVAIIITALLSTVASTAAVLIG